MLYRHGTIILSTGVHATTSLMDIQWTEEVGVAPPIPFDLPNVVDESARRAKKNARRRELYHSTRSKKVRKLAAEAERTLLNSELQRLRAELKKLKSITKKGKHHR